MSNPYDMFKVDSEQENNVGAVLEYPVPGHDDKAFRVRIVHAGDTNPHYRNALRARLKPLTFRIQNDLVSDEELEAIVKPVYADKIIKDWEVKVDGEWVKGIYGPDFTILPVTVENITNVLNVAPRLFVDIRKQAEAISTFKSDAIKDNSKN